MCTKTPANADIPDEMYLRLWPTMRKFQNGGRIRRRKWGRRGKRMVFKESSSLTWLPLIFLCLTESVLQQCWCCSYAHPSIIDMTNSETHAKCFKDAQFSSKKRNSCRSKRECHEMERKMGCPLAHQNSKHCWKDKSFTLGARKHP